MSTATSKSLCLTLALAALTTSTALSSTSSSSLCESCSNGESSFDSSIMIKSGPINVPSLSSTPTDESTTEDDDIATLRSNATIDEEDDDDNTSWEDIASQLPSELASLIATAQRATPAAAPTRDLAGSIRYYATFTDGSSCSSKSSIKFDAWETSYTTLEECCDMEFSWDYDDCMLSLQN